MNSGKATQGFSGLFCLWEKTPGAQGMAVETWQGSPLHVGCTSSWMWTWDHHRLWNCQESENQDSRLFPLGSEHNGQGVDWTLRLLLPGQHLVGSTVLAARVGGGREPPSLYL